MIEGGDKAIFLAELFKQILRSTECEKSELEARFREVLRSSCDRGESFVDSVSDTMSVFREVSERDIVQIYCELVFTRNGDVFRYDNGKWYQLER
jgi:hypothetical protein